MRSTTRYRRAVSLALAFALLLAFGGHAALADGLAETTTGLGLDSSATLWGQPVTFTATVAPVTPGPTPPSGSVVFYDNFGALPTSQIGTALVDDAGQATLVLSDLKPGNHSISAVYGGDATFDPSTSNAVSLTVGTKIDVLSTFSLRRVTVFSLQPVYFGGENVSSPLLAVTARCVMPDSEIVPTACDVNAVETLDAPFSLVRRFSKTHRAYRFSLDTSNLTPSTSYFLLVQVDDDPALQVIPFTTR